MKLKKIASLALAGVMAVSMLAGCATKAPTTGETTTTSDLTNAVLAAVTEKNITFTKGTDLEKAVAAYRVDYGSEGYVDAVTDLTAYDADLSKNTSLPTLKVADLEQKASKKDLDEALTGSATYVVSSTTIPAGASEEYAAKELAKVLDDKADGVANNIESGTLIDSAIVKVDDVNYNVKVNYTGTVYAYTSTADTGVVTYYMVYTVSYTGTATEIN